MLSSSTRLCWWSFWTSCMRVDLGRFYTTLKSSVTEIRWDCLGLIYSCSGVYELRRNESRWLVLIERNKIYWASFFLLWGFIKWFSCLPLIPFRLFLGLFLSIFKTSESMVFSFFWNFRISIHSLFKSLQLCGKIYLLFSLFVIRIRQTKNDSCRGFDLPWWEFSHA